MESPQFQSIWSLGVCTWFSNWFEFETSNETAIVSLSDCAASEFHMNYAIESARTQQLYFSRDWRVIRRSFRTEIGVTSIESLDFPSFFDCKICHMALFFSNFIVSRIFKLPQSINKIVWKKYLFKNIKILKNIVLNLIDQNCEPWKLCNKIFSSARQCMTHNLQAESFNGYDMQRIENLQTTRISVDSYENNEDLFNAAGKLIDPHFLWLFVQAIF